MFLIYSSADSMRLLFTWAVSYNLNQAKIRCYALLVRKHNQVLVETLTRSLSPYKIIWQCHTAKCVVRSCESIVEARTPFDTRFSIYEQIPKSKYARPSEMTKFLQCNLDWSRFRQLLLYLTPKFRLMSQYMGCCFSTNWWWNTNVLLVFAI
jgi:hypothetical protein